MYVSFYKKSFFLIMCLIFSIFIINTNAQENHQVTLKASIEYKDSVGNVFLEETEPFVLTLNSIIQIIISDGYQQSIYSGQTAIFKHNITNRGNVDVDLDFNVLVPNSDSLLSYRLYNVSDDQENTLYDHMKNKRILTLNAGDEQEVILEIITNESLQEDQNYQFKLSGTGNSLSGKASPVRTEDRKTEIIDALTVNRISDGVDLIYIGNQADSSTNQALFDIPNQNAHPYNAREVTSENIVLDFTPGEELVFYLRVENDSIREKEYEFDAGLYSKESFPEDWKLKVIDISTSETIFERGDRNHVQKIKIKGIPLEGRYDNYTVFKVTVIPPVLGSEGSYVWNYQNSLNDLSFLPIDNDQNGIYEQPILFKVRSSEGGTDQLAVYFQSGNRYTLLQASSEGDKNRDVLANSEQELIYNVFNLGNVRMNLKIDRSIMEGIEMLNLDELSFSGKDGAIISDCKTSEDCQTSLNPGEKRQFRWKVSFKAPPQYSESGYEPVRYKSNFRVSYLDSILNPESDDWKQADQQNNFNVVKPEIKVEKEVYKYEKCQNANDPYQGIKLISGNAFKEGDCLKVKIQIANQGEHRYFPENINVKFPVLQGLEFVENSVNIYQKGSHSIENSNLLSEGRDPSYFVFDLNQINKTFGKEFKFGFTRQNNPIKIDFLLRVNNFPNSGISVTD